MSVCTRMLNYNTISDIETNILHFNFFICKNPSIKNQKIRQTVLKDKLFDMKKSYQFPTTKELQAQIDKITELKKSGHLKKQELDENLKRTEPERITNARQITTGRRDYFR